MGLKKTLKKVGKIALKAAPIAAGILGGPLAGAGVGALAGAVGKGKPKLGNIVKGAAGGALAGASGASALKGAKGAIGAAKAAGASGKLALLKAGATGAAKGAIGMGGGAAGGGAAASPTGGFMDDLVTPATKAAGKFGKLGQAAGWANKNMSGLTAAASTVGGIVDARNQNRMADRQLDMQDRQWNAEQEMLRTREQNAASMMPLILEAMRRREQATAPVMI